MEEMNDRDLHDLLKNWVAPTAPPSLKHSVIEKYRARQKWSWRWFLSGSLQIPAPIVSMAVLLIVVLSVAVLSNAPPSSILSLPSRIITRVVKAPINTERIVTQHSVSREHAVSADPFRIDFSEFQPVASIKPRIIRRGQDDDQN